MERASPGARSVVRCRHDSAVRAAGLVVSNRGGRALGGGTDGLVRHAGANGIPRRSADADSRQLPERYRGGTAEVRRQGDRASDKPEARHAAMSLNHALAEKGRVAPHWPKESGGAGMTPMEQFLFNQEIAEAAAPLAASMHGVAMLGPTLIVHGTDEQRSELLPKILTAAVVWCQGYSEPRDIASLQTRAVRDGDEYVVNGQQIWTSGAQTADWVFTLVRTDPEAPKHRGISSLMIDLKAPGPCVRPIINMAWAMT
jgi:alkylation response protein AidB-like acyl-CoA dehydrogenase